MNIAIIVNGSLNTRAGTVSNELPELFFPTVVGKIRYVGLFISAELREYEIGYEAMRRRGIHQLIYPLRYILNPKVDMLEKIWFSTFTSKLTLSLEETALVFSEPVLTTEATRERIKSFFFTELKISHLYLIARASLVIFSSGKVSGLALQMGEMSSRCIPVIDGYPIPHAIESNIVCGESIREQLTNLLVAEGYAFRTRAEDEIVDHIKRTLSYVALDAQQEEAKNDLVDYELPDGQVISLGSCRFLCTEALFQEIGVGGRTLHLLPRALALSLNSLTPSERKFVLKNFVLAGGVSRTRGLLPRLRLELERLFPLTQINIILPQSSQCSAWIGGRIVASTPKFRERCLSRRKYLEDHS